MKTHTKGLVVSSLFIIFSLVLGSCQSTTPTPERIVETVVVTQVVAGTPVEVVVTPTPGAEETPAPSTQFIPADSMVACLPLPEGVTSAAGGAHLASQASSFQGQTTLAQLARKARQAYYGIPVLSVPEQTGKIYRIGVFEDVRSLNFFSANGPNNTIWNAYMLPPRLTMYALSEKYFTLTPWVAAVTGPDPLAEEGEFWTTQIPIRQDISWSDGEPLTAHDVAFTANTALKFGIIAGNWGAWFDGNFLDHVEAVDDYTVKYVYHTRPGMARHEYGSLQGPILAEHYWKPVVDELAAPIDALAADASDEDRAAAQKEATDALYVYEPAGEPHAGAFLLDRWEQGAFLDSSANPDYFLRGLRIEQFADGAYRDSEGVTVGSPEGEAETVVDVGPHVDAVVYTIYGSQDAAILALRNGDVDFVLNSLGLQRGLANQIMNDPNLTVLENPSNSFRYLSFNNRRRPMNDCSFRQAVAALIDREFVTTTILQGAAFPKYAFVAEANSQWYYDGVTKIGEGLDRQQRLDLAIAILEGAGYSWEGDQKPTWDSTGNSVIPGGGLIMPDGMPVPTLELWAPGAGYDPLRSTFAIWIETWLKEVGIPAEAQLAGFNTLIPRIFTEQDFDMYILGWSLGIFPSGLRDFFSEEQSVSPGDNAGGYINPEFEELSLQLLLCPDYESCKPIADQIQDMLSVETPYVVLFDTGILEAFRSDVLEYPFLEQLSGLQYTHIGGVLQAEVKVK